MLCALQGKGCGIRSPLWCRLRQKSAAVVGRVVIAVVRVVVAAHRRLLRAGAGSVAEAAHLLLGDGLYSCRLCELEGDDSLRRYDHAPAGRRCRASNADSGAGSRTNGRPCTAAGDSTDDGSKRAKAKRAINGGGRLIAALLLPELSGQWINDSAECDAVDLEAELTLTFQSAGLSGVDHSALHGGTARDCDGSIGSDVVEHRAVKGRARLNVVRVNSAVDADAKHRSRRDGDRDTRLLSSRGSVGLVRTVVIERTAWGTVGLRLSLIWLRLAVGLWLSIGLWLIGIRLRLRLILRRTVPARILLAALCAIGLLLLALILRRAIATRILLIGRWRRVGRLTLRRTVASRILVGL